MRKMIFVGLCMASSLPGFSQKNAEATLPSFGVVSKADLEMSTCDFDEKAEAVMMIDDGALDFVAGSGMVLKHRVRIKILNKNGLDWANVHLPYLSDRDAQDIKNLEAQTYNLDASGNIVTTKVEKALIYDKKLSKKYAEKVFSFPEVRIGSIIEYRYRHTGMGLLDWYFQKEIPVQFSQFITDFPQEVELSVIPYCNAPYDSKTESKGMRTVKTYKMTRVPAFHEEPYIINEDFYRDRLETTVTAYFEDGRRINRVTNWLQVIKYLMDDEDFGLQIKKNIPHTADLDHALESQKDPYQKMKTIYKYVEDNMQWNESPGIWALEGVKSAWRDRKGTVGEINLILINLLKDAGLSAYPVLVSTHDNGVVNEGNAGTVDYPGFNQFNKVLAYVELDGTTYILDATQKNIPVHLIPPDVTATQGLVISKLETFDWGWKPLWRSDLSHKNTILIEGDIDAAGKMNGNVSITSFDYAKLARVPVARKGKQAFVARYITESNPGVDVKEVRFENVESDSLPLVQNVEFSMPLNSSGDYRYFSTNIMSGLETNPFIADKRAYDVFFGYNQSYTIVGNYSLDDGFEFDALPKNLKLIMPDTSVVISRISQVSGNRLQTRIQLDFRKPVFTADEYPDLQEFYHSLFDILNEQFVVKKKK